MCFQLDDDASNGYEAIAPAYIAGRGTRPTIGDPVGAATVRAWAETLPAGATVLDLGCGPGEPITRILRDAGLTVYAVDASPTMVATFRERFPDAQIECNSVEASDFFGRKFDGVIAWGLLFLLEPAAQAHVISKVARAIEPGGHFVFTSLKQRHAWLDAKTQRPSQSLGAEEYERLLGDAGMLLVGEAEDAGDNHYYFARKGP